jgi:uncharacterized lipoprotein YajG
MTRMKILIVATAALVLAACAAPTPTKDEPVAEQKSYRVGSHLPVKDKDSTGSSTSTTNTAPPPFQPPAGYAPPRNMGGG